MASGVKGGRMGEDKATVADLADRVSCGGEGGQWEASFGGSGTVADFCYVCLCVDVDVRDCGWTHLWAAGARPCRMLKCPVAAAASSYGPGAAVRTLLRV